MTTKNRNAQKKAGGFDESQFDVPCDNSYAPESLLAYISGALESSEEEKMEEHMLACRSCRGFFITILSVRAEARAGDASNGASKVTRLGDFRKRWH
jgi:predicted anti-sigma-YlaC factor YlaD